MRASVLAEEIHFPGKTIYFFLWRCAIFFSIGIPNASRRNCEELRGIYSFSFLTVPCRHFFQNFRHFSCTSQSYCLIIPSLRYICGAFHILGICKLKIYGGSPSTFFLPLVVDHMYVVADEEVRSAFFRTLSSTAPDGIIHWALAFCSRLLLVWSSMMRLRRILPVVGQNAVKEM